MWFQKDSEIYSADGLLRLDLPMAVLAPIFIGRYRTAPLYVAIASGCPVLGRQHIERTRIYLQRGGCFGLDTELGGGDVGACAVLHVPGGGSQATRLHFPDPAADHYVLGNEGMVAEDLHGLHA